MRRVRFIHAGRQLFTPAMVKAVVFLASVIATISLVSIQHVLENMSRLDMRAYAPYIAQAFMHTNLAVQSFILLAVAAVAWLSGDIVRNFRQSRAALRAA